MHLHPEDPRLTAYVLGELGPEDSAAVERAAAGNPELQMKIQEMKDIQRFLAVRLAPPADMLPPRLRENTRRTSKPISFAALSETLKAWLIPASAMAALTLATIILIRMPSETRSPLEKSTHTTAPLPSESAKLPAPTLPTQVPAVSPPAPLAAPAQRGSVAAADFPTLDLPIQSGKSNLLSISKSIRDERQLPPHEAVRLEEILNNFPLRLNGVTAIARDAADKNGMSVHVATLSTELIPCPWKPSAMLLLISIRGNEQKDCDVKVAFHANPENVLCYRLLGFTPTEGSGAGSVPTRLRAKSTAALAIEIEPSKPGGQLGSLEWSTDDKPAPPISLAHKNDAEPSDDARFAALVCTYGLWLAGEQVGIIDADIVSGLAREIATSNLPADRADFLNLIDRSLHL